MSPRLQSLLGEELSLGLDAKGTARQGSFELRLDSPRGRCDGPYPGSEGTITSNASCASPPKRTGSVSRSMTPNSPSRTRPAILHSPDGTRRPYWLLRPLKPGREAYQLPGWTKPAGA